MNFKKIDNKLYFIDECKQCEGTEKVSYIGERKDTCLACKDGKILVECEIEFDANKRDEYAEQLRLYKLIMDALGVVDRKVWYPRSMKDWYSIEANKKKAQTLLSQYKGVGGVITENK